MDPQRLDEFFSFGEGAPEDAMVKGECWWYKTECRRKLKTRVVSCFVFVCFVPVTHGMKNAQKEAYRSARRAVYGMIADVESATDRFAPSKGAPGTDFAISNCFMQVTTAPNTSTP